MAIDIYGEAHKKFQYNPETGELKNRLSGKTYITKCRRYTSVELCGKKHRAHRVIFLMMTGRWPDQVDHINRNTLDNRWCNLREVTNQQNQHNRKINKNNTTGVTGVRRRKGGEYSARIMVDRIKISLGSFDSLFDAAMARYNAEVIYGITKHNPNTSAKLYIDSAVMQETVIKTINETNT